MIIFLSLLVGFLSFSIVALVLSYRSLEKEYIKLLASDKFFDDDVVMMRKSTPVIKFKGQSV